MQLVCVDGGVSSFSFDFDDGFQKMFRLCSSAVQDFFIPKQVSGNYMDHVKWKLLHRVFSSALQVLATQVIKFCITILKKIYIYIIILLKFKGNGVD